MARHDYQEVLRELRERKRKESFGDRMGRIHEVKYGQNGVVKARVVIGGTKEKPMLSPWLHTTDHRGGSRERDFYRKGQNVRISAPGGDLRQATLTPWAESKDYQSPSHFNGAGEESKIFQLENARQTWRKDAHEVWLADQDQGQPDVKGNGVNAATENGAERKKQSQGSQQSGGSPKVIQRMKPNMLTGRHGANRYAAGPEGAKIKASEIRTWVVADAQEGHVIVVAAGIPFVDKPWVIRKMPDPLPDDDGVHA